MWPQCIPTAAAVTIWYKAEWPRPTGLRIGNDPALRVLRLLTSKVLWHRHPDADKGIAVWLERPRGATRARRDSGGCYSTSSSITHSGAVPPSLRELILRLSSFLLLRGLRAKLASLPSLGDTCSKPASFPSYGVYCIAETLVSVLKLPRRTGRAREVQGSPICTFSPPSPTAPPPIPSCRSGHLCCTTHWPVL